MDDVLFGVVVGFEEGSHEAWNGESAAVEDVDGLGSGPGFAAEADAGAPGLIGFEVGAGGDFEVAVYAGGEDFEVVALASFFAHVSGAEEEDAVVKSESLEDDFGVFDKGFEFVVASFGEDEFDQFDFIELVHAEDAARVATGGSGFTAEARRVGGVLHGERGAVEDFAGVDVGDGDLGGGDEVEVVAGFVEILFEFGKVAGADEAAGKDEGGRPDFVVAALGLLVEHEVDEGADEARALAGIEGEPGAGDFGRSLEIDEAEAFGNVPVGDKGFAGGFCTVGAGDDVVVFVHAIGDGFVGEVGELEFDVVELGFEGAFFFF